MSSMHYEKGGKKVQRFCGPFLCWSPLMILSSSCILLVSFRFSLVWDFPAKKVSLVFHYVKYEALYCCLSHAIISFSCSLKQKAHSCWLSLLLHLIFESGEDGSQNEWQHLGSILFLRATE